MRWLAAIVLAWTAMGQDRPAIRTALDALTRGDFQAAETALRAEVQVHPNDAASLTLLGVALDSLGKKKEAGPVHQRAVANAPKSPDVLNNYANHLLNTGDEDGARKVYLQVVALDAAQGNANVQLARLSLKRKNGAEALGYLKRLPPDQQGAPPIAILRLEALYEAGDTTAGDTLAARLSAAPADLQLDFAAGLALANAGQFEKAESFFNNALAVSPTDFNVLVNLGAVASRAGHHQRAREVLETAVHQQPQNVEALYELAVVDVELKQPEAAVRLLAQAAGLDPQRADVQKLLAITTMDLGALEDSATAWERYRKLAPNDDTARRERGYTAVLMSKFQEGIADLKWYLSRHPDDPVAHYELGLAESKDDASQGMAHLDKALQLKPDFVVALSTRGGLHYQQGNFEAALKDLEAAARLRPTDAVSLDRLGQTYLSLDRSEDAARVLRKAAELAPGDSKVQLHLARALADAGHAEESKAAMDRFRLLGPVTAAKAVPGGLVDYLALPPEQQRADYRARVEKVARANPKDAASQVTYLKLLLDDGKTVDATNQAHTIAALKPSAPALADAGHALLEAGQYAPARDLLEQAASSSRDAEIDLALAIFHSAGASAGLDRLQRIPEADRTGDYHLARAQMLDAAGRKDDAAAALQQALRAAPKRPDLYRQAATLLARSGRAGDAVQLLDQAVRSLSQDREILLLRATTLELADRTADAEQQLAQIQSRWPEWHAPWVARGVILQMHQRSQEAREALDTAFALGARSPEATFFRSHSGSTTESLQNRDHLFLAKPPREW